MRERRRFVRLDLNVNVKWRKIDQVEEIKENTAKNISIGGICLIVEEKLNEGDYLELKINLPNQKEIHAYGRVVWIDEYEILGAEYGKKYDAGIEFLKIKEEDQQELEKFIFTFLYEKAKNR